MEDHKAVIDALELCAITLNVMKDAKADYMNTVYTTIASLIVAIGWFLTSSEAREFIGNRKRTSGQLSPRYFSFGCSIISMSGKYRDVHGQPKPQSETHVL